MNDTDQPKDAGRRNFLALATTAAPAVAVTALAGQQAEAAETEDQGSGLRKTAHVRAYLDSARF
ncbi:hypothetical protein Ga0609869_000539 [Rhodovulum iodosum]|uniref:Twin-arginine translocation pathway signal protein n=1 Tax=Rhodovulum iodosum TaxID=68291 RepID=A0ABV3XPD8_9RHOB|nr:twin-arginine translocation pathway signal protein [Rhodovulum robiginosum]RSK31516.1 twin-arginine translocation pathway signal protein [Rhodovulum robiginosum]